MRVWNPDAPLSKQIDWFVATLTENGENADVFSVEWLSRLRDEIAALEAENKRLRDGLSYIARRGYTGASHVALELLNGKVYPADPRAALEEGGDG